MRKKQLLSLVIIVGVFLSNCQAAHEERIAEVTSVAEETQSANVTQIAAEIFATQTAQAPTPSPYEAGETKVSEVDGMTLVYVPAGSAWIGSGEGRLIWAREECDRYTWDCSPENFQDEIPLHTVSHQAFWIDQTEVTNAMFAKFVEETGYTTTPEIWQFSYVHERGEWEEPERDASWKMPRGEESRIDDMDNFPVVHVSWYDAWSYCAWAGRRLPTEVEWEKAAGGQEGFMFPWGDDASFYNRANYDSESNEGFRDLAPIGSFSSGASPYGVLDMSGNVHEWVFDGYIPYSEIDIFSDDFVNTESDMRVIRGGSFESLSMDLRTASRNALDPMKARSDVGFRCVLSEKTLPEPQIPEEYLPDLVLLRKISAFEASPEGERLNFVGSPTGEKWELEPGIAEIVGQYDDCASLKVTVPGSPEMLPSWIHVETFSYADDYILYQPCSSFEEVLIRPHSGLMYPPFTNITSEDDDSGRLEVVNQSQQDIYVSIVNTQSENAYGLYVWGGETEELRGIQDGSYEVYLTSGSDWSVADGRFRNARAYTKFDDSLKFSKNVLWTLTLNVSEGGNAPASRINSDDFPPPP